MKKFSFLLSVILVFCLAFVTSCSSFFSSNKSGATVSFRLNQDVVKALASKVSSSRADIPAELEGTMLYVTLYVNSVPLTQNTPLTEEGAFITFENIVVGSEVSASVEVKKDSELLAAGTSSESLIVQKGENLLSVTLQFVADGQIFFGDHVTIQLASASDEIWLNQGEWSFKLLDDSGNDILADVDWDNEENKYLLNVITSLRKGHTEISGGSDNFDFSYNQLAISQGSPLLQGGDLELTLTLMPGKETYINNNQKTVTFPQFEPVSSTITISVNDACRIDISNYDENNFEALVTGYLNNFNSYSGDLMISFTGTTSFSYNDVCSHIKSVITNRNSKYGLDLSDLSSTDDDKKIGGNGGTLFQDCTTISSFITPQDATEIGELSFSGCNNLKSVKMCSTITLIGDTSFSGCSNLAEVIIPENSALKRIDQYAFVGTKLSEFTVPKNVIAIAAHSFPTNDGFVVKLADKSGTWYAAGEEFSTGDGLWNAWCSESLIAPNKGTGAYVDVPVNSVNIENFSDYINSYYWLYKVEE